MVTKTKRKGTPTETTRPADVDAGRSNPLRAGLKVLGKVRDDVVQHQSRVFEAILGIEPGAGWSGLVKRDAGSARSAQEALGLRKFEAVFDQRVASALERLGMPSLEALQGLGDELAALRAEVAALKTAAQPAPRTPRVKAAPKVLLRKR